jgi:glycopeptide antibiotics resistance protein
MYLRSLAQISPFQAAVLIIITITTILIQKKDKTKTKRQKAATTLLAIMIYIILLHTILKRTSSEQIEINLIPFWSYKEIAQGDQDLFWSDLFNILLFIPIGILMPLTQAQTKQESQNVLLKTTITAALFSAAIELTQLILHKGLCEFDDVFNNTLGAVLGCCFTLIIQKAVKVIKNKNQKRAPKPSKK